MFGSDVCSWFWNVVSCLALRTMPRQGCTADSTKFLGSWHEDVNISTSASSSLSPDFKHEFESIRSRNRTKSSCAVVMTYISQILSPSETIFIISAHRLTNIALFALIATLYLQGESPIYILNEDTQPVILAIEVSHTSLQRWVSTKYSTSQLECI